jgi:hypothetical protein
VILPVLEDKKAWHEIARPVPRDCVHSFLFTIITSDALCIPLDRVAQAINVRSSLALPSYKHVCCSSSQLLVPGRALDKDLHLLQ